MDRSLNLVNCSCNLSLIGNFAWLLNMLGKWHKFVSVDSWRTSDLVGNCVNLLLHCIPCFWLSDQANYCKKFMLNGLIGYEHFTLLQLKSLPIVNITLFFSSTYWCKRKENVKSLLPYILLRWKREKRGPKETISSGFLWGGKRSWGSSKSESLAPDYFMQRDLHWSDTYTQRDKAVSPVLSAPVKVLSLRFGTG